MFHKDRHDEPEYSSYDQDQINQSFTNACRAKDFSLMQYLCTANELSYRAQLDVRDNPLFRVSVQQADMGCLQELLKLPRTAKHGDFDYWEPIFAQACLHGKKDVVNLLLTLEDFAGTEDLHNKVFLCAVHNGSLSVTYALLSSTDNPVNIHFNNEQALMLACSDGDLEMVELLLCCPELKEHADISAENGKALMCACKSGVMEVVKYVINHLEWNKIDAQACINESFKQACEKGNVKIIDYLLNHYSIPHKPDIDVVHEALYKSCQYNRVKAAQYLLSQDIVKIDIHHDDDCFVRVAANYGRLELLKYLLQGCDIKEHANIHARSDEAFCSAYKCEERDVLRYLIVDYQIALTPEIIKRVNSGNQVIKDEILDMVNTRQFHEYLQEKMDASPVQRKQKNKL